MEGTMSASRIATVLAIAAIAAFGAAPAASAKTKTTVTISAFNQEDPPFFIGEVISKKTECRKSRRVTLYRAQDGQDERVGSSKTISGEGTWAWIIQVPDAVSGDAYYAQVTE